MSVLIGAAPSRTHEPCLTAPPMNRREFIRSALVLSAAAAASRRLGAAAAAEEGLATDLAWVPLAARSGPRGPTLFTTLPSALTGLKGRNAYDDPAMWGRLNNEFVSGSIGTGVAVGDFDGDGRPDIFMASKTGPNRLFRNLGGLRFEDVTERAGVAGPTDAWKQGAAFADVNNDGLLDIYVCRFNAPNLLYVNQGDGTFKEMAHAYGLDVTDACVMAAFCDYDRDGWLDVYITTNLLNKAAQPDGRRGYLLHNNRNGTFTNVTERAGITGELQSHSATWWDYDEDGWPDLYVAADFWKPDQLYRNNRDGTFTDVISSVVPHMPHFSMGADLGDLNNDGHLGLLVADMAARTRYKDHRGMAKLRAALPDDQQYPRAAPQYMQNALLINTGSGHLLEAAHLAGLHATDWTFSVRLEDLDLDGRLDAYFTNGMVREFTNADLVLRSLSAESPSESIRIMKASPPLCRAAPGVPQPRRPALRGGQRGLGARPRRSGLWRGVRRPRRRRGSRPRLRQLRRRAHRLPQRRRHRPCGRARAARHGIQPLRNRRHGADRDR
jgi:hypothetical protein